MEYSVHAIGRGETTFTLTDTQLSIHSHKREQRTEIPLSEVRKVRLLSMQGIYYTYLWTPQGKTKILSRSIHGPARLEDKPGEYRLFVTELHAKLGAAAPHAAYLAGSTVYFIMGWVLVALGVLVLVLRLGFGSRGVLRFGFAAALGVPLILLGRVKHYLPDSLPEKYLP